MFAMLQWHFFCEKPRRILLAPIMSNRIEDMGEESSSAGVCPPAERPLCGFVDDLDRGGSINR